MSTRLQKVMVQPINLIFRFFQQRTVVQIWLFEDTKMRIEGIILGFDEFMNLMMDEAVEVHYKKSGQAPTRKELGRILLKGDNITGIQAAAP
ncbi:U6 snRNA-associated Sm-like protein LSm6 [Sorochytrium milnesiophthora]